MKFIINILFTIAFMLFACPIFGQQRAHNNIYHQGWADLNKNGKKDIYEDRKQPVEKRVEDLLSQMTLTEKAVQLATLYGYGAVLKDSLPTAAWKNEIWSHGIANIDEHLTGERVSKTYSYPHSAHAEAINATQRFFIEETRLGVPVDFTDEGIAGLKNTKATSFPPEIGQGCTFDKELIQAIGRVEGREAKALGYTNVYAPEMDVSSDPRWGRTPSCYGSSPFLCGELGTAMVRGMQAQGIAATLKHYAVYSVPIGGRDGGVRTHPRVAPREMREIYLEPFRQVIENARPLGVMASYNEYDGVPVITSKWFMDTVLRKKYGFDGYVVSDSYAVGMVYAKHHVAADYEDAIRQVLEAGLNVRTNFTPPEHFIDPLMDAVKKGKISMNIIDKRVAEVLTVKYRLGLFDDPYVKDTRSADRIVHNKDSRALSLRAAHESIVLLKNDTIRGQDKGLLPLNISEVRSLAVIGPAAIEEKNLRMGYGPLDIGAISVYDGIKKAFSPDCKISYAKGIDYTDLHWPQSDAEDFPLTEEEKKDVNNAVAAASASDMVIMVLGDLNGTTVGESHSRLSLQLPGHQEALLEAVAATGKPVVLVLLNGRPLSINWAAAHIPAIIEAWYPGEYTGKAVADVLTGKYNPGGKLSIPFPKSAGQAVLTFPMKPGDEGKGEARVTGFLYPFGHGTSYTAFHYADLKIDPSKPKTGENIQHSFTVTNTGKVVGDAVPQLYIHDEVSSVTTYVKKLRGFSRITLAPGESKQVVFNLTPDDLSLYDREMEFTEEPGWFRAMIGESSEDIRIQNRFEVIR